MTKKSKGKSVTLRGSESKSPKAKTFRTPYGTGPSQYFTQVTEDDINHYNTMTPSPERDAFYMERLHPTLSKLCEYIINRFKYSWAVNEEGFDPIHRELLGHVTEKLGTYDKTKGFKAFSYFSVMAKHYMIQRNERSYRKLQTDLPIEEVFKEDREDGHAPVTLHTDYGYDRQELMDFFKAMTDYFEKNARLFIVKESDLDTIRVIIDVLRDDQDMFFDETICKKTVLSKIRDKSGCSTQQISRLIKKMKRHYFKNRSEWLNQLPSMG